MFIQSTVQWNYIIYFHIRVSFWTTFSTSFLKGAHNLKEIANIQGLTVLTVSYLDMTTNPLTKCYYINEIVYFIYRLFISFISTLSFLLFLHTKPWRYKRVCQSRYFFILCSILLTRCRNMKKTLLYHMRTYNTKKVSIWTWPPVHYL